MSNNKNRWLISDICVMVATGLCFQRDHSDTTIRTLINDMIDSREKEGYMKVPTNYSQPRAVAKVKAHLKVWKSLEANR